MSLSREDRLKLAVIDPELAEYLKTTNFPSIDTSDTTKVIAGLRMYMKSQHKPAEPDSGVLERDIFFPARDGFQLRARVFEPAATATNDDDDDDAAAAAAAASATPLVVYYHGGGWTIGSPEDTASSCRRLVQNLGVVCIAPGYRQGPEHPFPASINDSWGALKWIAAHAETEFSVSLSSAGFIIGGSSAGGSMAAILTHLARDESLTPAITGLFLLAPMILPPEVAQEALPSEYKDAYLSRTQEECQKDPILSPALAQIFHDSARGDLQSPMFVPFIWPTGHAGLPRTYFQVCGMDTLRDEDLIYEQVLKKNGTETRLDVYPGMPHIFWGSFPFLGQGKKAALDLDAGIKWLLRRE